MTTTQTTSAGSAGLMWTATVEAPSSGWAGPPRGAIGTLPSYRLRRVTEHIHQNVDKNLRLAELAALVYMSPYHFARLFKGSMGVPPHRFVVRQRIARASAFLATPELSIARISRMVGFRTPSHFTTAFRRVTGLTPRGYRTRYLRESQPGDEGGCDELH
jgi:AraC family transcriptional regulator